MGGAVGGTPHNGTSNHGAQTGIGGSSRGNGERSGDSNHRGVQRSISASASSKTRKGSTSVEPGPAVIGKIIFEALYVVYFDQLFSALFNLFCVDFRREITEKGLK